MYDQAGLTVKLLTANGNQITEFAKDGRIFVEGRKGSKYQILVQNHTHTRIKVIISVDGLDIITGKRATPGSGGYVINAYATEIFDGWRINNSQIREFFFTSMQNSYNNKTGNDTNNLGVIGVMAYKEYIPFYTTSYLNTIDNGRYFVGYSSTVPVNASYTPTSSVNMLHNAEPTSTRSLHSEVKTSAKLLKSAIGTGMGETKQSPTQKVHATWESAPFATSLIYYKSRKELEAMGIIVAPVKQKPLPSAFAGYCRQV
jgi:hypothetical protein